MSNKNLLLSNYYVQSSINYITDITENIYTASITERLRMYLVSCRVQNPRPVKLILYSVANCSLPLQHLC